MSETIHITVLKQVVSELVGEPEDNKQTFTAGILNYFIKDLEVEAELLLKSGKKPEELVEYYRSRHREILERVVDVLIKTSEFTDRLYLGSYERLKAFLAESDSYGDLFTEICEDEGYLSEIFVRLVEEREGVAITSAKDLQDITGITEIYGYWDEKKGETVPYGDRTPTKKEAQEIATKQISETFKEAMYYRYFTALKNMLEAGGKYSDLLQIKPQYFNLPDTWSGCLATDQYSTILWAIEDVFLIGEPNPSVRPDLKTIAQAIEAPYSVLMDIHKKCNQWKLQN